MKEYSTNELLIIWLDSFIGLEYHKKIELYNKLKGKTQLKSEVVKLKDYIVSVSNEQCYTSICNSSNGEYVNYVLSNLSKRNITAITLESENYPKELKETSVPPLVLYAKGNLDLLKEKKFSIVGSRKSLPLSVKLAESYTKGIIDIGFVPVTGIAEGIDCSVLKESLNHGGKCISVVAGGFDNIYPASHKELLKRVEENGLVLSEYPPEIKSMPYYFPVRNRIIAGLSVGTLIVSAGTKSGTMYTAEYAMEYGRDLFAIPYSVGIESGVGCNELIKKTAILTDSFSDISSYYGIEEEKKEVEISAEESEIIKVLKSGAKHIDIICKELNKQVYELMPTLTTLEIKGIVIKSGINIYSVIKS